MDTLVVQVGSRHGRTTEIHKSRGEDIRIGRGFNNDLVLTDPYVAPDQLRIAKQDGQWFVEVLDHTNPVLLNDKALPEGTERIRPADKLKVGRTNLFIFSEDHPVEATHKLLLSSWLHGDNVGLLMPFSLLVFVCLLDGFVDYINYATTDEWSQYMYGAVGLAVLILLWAGAWSLLGRITRHQSYFPVQLLVTTAVFGAMIPVYYAIPYVHYISNSTVVYESLLYLFGLVVLGVLLKLNLLISTSVKHTTNWGFGVSATIFVLAYALINIGQDDFEAYPTYPANLKPPFAHITRDRGIDQYFNRLNVAIDSIEVDEEERTSRVSEAGHR
jgi:hypothetical protein